jgi:hypothetical protein
MSEKRIKKKELKELLEENYYTLASTGADAVMAIFDDFNNHRFSSNLEEWGISAERLLQVINELLDDWLEAGKMDVRAMDWRK